MSKEGRPFPKGKARGVLPSPKGQLSLDAYGNLPQGFLEEKAEKSQADCFLQVLRDEVFSS